MGPATPDGSGDHYRHDLWAEGGQPGTAPRRDADYPAITAGVRSPAELVGSAMRKRLAFAGSIVVATLATTSVILSSIAITLAEALEETD